MAQAICRASSSALGGSPPPRRRNSANSGILEEIGRTGIVLKALSLAEAACESPALASYDTEFNRSLFHHNFVICWQADLTASLLSRAVR